MHDLDKFEGFTPGPWRVENKTTLIWGACNPDDNTSYGMGYPVAEAQMPRPWNRDKPTDEQIDANAALIASAPDLLALAKEQRDRIKRLEAALAVADEFFRDRADYADDTGSTPEMKALSEIDAIMKGYVHA